MRVQVRVWKVRGDSEGTGKGLGERTWGTGEGLAGERT